MAGFFVVFRGRKRFYGPVLVIKGQGLCCIGSEKLYKLGKDGPGHGLFIFSSQGRRSRKACKSIGTITGTGPVMDLPKGAALTESLTGKPHPAPESPVIQGKKLGMPGHPGGCLKHRLG